MEEASNSFSLDGSISSEIWSKIESEKKRRNKLREKLDSFHNHDTMTESTAEPSSTSTPKKKKHHHSKKDSKNNKTGTTTEDEQQEQQHESKKHKKRENNNRNNNKTSKSRSKTRDSSVKSTPISSTNNDGKMMIRDFSPSKRKDDGGEGLEIPKPISLQSKVLQRPNSVLDSDGLEFLPVPLCVDTATETSVSHMFTPSDIDQSSHFIQDDNNIDELRKMIAKVASKRDNDDDEMVCALTEDIYSLIYTSSIISTGFRFAIIIFIFQFFIELLILLDLFDFTTGDNMLKMPPGITKQVRVAQVLAIILISFTTLADGDLAVSLTMLANGYNKRVNHGNPHATYPKWLLSGLLQLATGLVMISVYFVLLIQSTTIIGLMLNFAALNFVGQIDDISFYLASKGYFGPSIEEDCVKVSEIKVPSHKQWGPRWRPLLFILLNLCMFVPYSFVAKNQLKGTYLCHSIYMQFSDEHNFYLPYYSGVYKQETKRINGHAVYTDESSSTLRLAYCESLQIWTLTSKIDQQQQQQHDPCYKSLMYSPVSKTYDVVSLMGETWYVHDYQKDLYLPSNRFYMKCNDCDDSEYGDCRYGYCNNNQCICNDGRYGIDCEFSTPCNSLVTDARSEPLQLTLPLVNSNPSMANTDENSSSSILNIEALDLTTFELLTTTTTEYSMGDIVQVNHRPVYISTSYLDQLEFGKALIIFFGRRWALTIDIFFYNEIDPCWDKLITDHGSIKFDINSYYNKCGIPSIDDVAHYLNTNFHPHDIKNNRYIPYFFSSPIDVGTPSDSLLPSGSDISWYQSNRRGYNGSYQIDLTQPPNSKFMCPYCNNNTNSCLHFATCSSITNTCDCGEYYVGSLCEKALTCHDDNIQCYGENSTCLPNGKCDCGDDKSYGVFCQLSR